MKGNRNQSAYTAGGSIGVKIAEMVKRNVIMVYDATFVKHATERPFATMVDCDSSVRNVMGAVYADTASERMCAVRAMALAYASMESGNMSVQNVVQSNATWMVVRPSTDSGEISGTT